MSFEEIENDIGYDFKMTFSAWESRESYRLG